MVTDATFQINLISLSSVGGILVVADSTVTFERAGAPHTVLCADVTGRPTGYRTTVFLGGKLSPCKKSNCSHSSRSPLHSPILLSLSPPPPPTLSLSFYTPSSLIPIISPHNLFFLPYYPPELHPPIISGDSTVNESGSLFLDCNPLTSFPTPTVAWYGPQGGGPLTEARELRFPSVQRSMSGRYHCTASNNGNSETSFVNVIVQCKWRV